MLTGPALLAAGFAGALGAGSVPAIEAAHVDLSIPAPAAIGSPLGGFPAAERARAGGHGPDRFTGLHWGLEGLFAAAMVADCVQTLHTARSDYSEANPILGPHPKRLVTAAYFLATGVAHAAVARLLPTPWRELWQLTAIGVEGATIRGNLRAGVGFSF